MNISLDRIQNARLLATAMLPHDLQATKDILEILNGYEAALERGFMYTAGQPKPRQWWRWFFGLTLAASPASCGGAPFTTFDAQDVIEAGADTAEDAGVDSVTVHLDAGSDAVDARPDALSDAASEVAQTCNSLIGPDLTSGPDNLTGGVRFHVTRDVTLVSFVFQNAGLADSIMLGSNVAVVPAGNPNYTATVYWPLLAGQTYTLVNGTPNNIMFRPFNGQNVGMDVIVEDGIPSEYWLGFNRFVTCR
jgi:hypothetical protein